MTPLPSDAAPAADTPPPVRCHMDALPAGYLAALRDARAAALDAGLSYQEPFAQFVLERAAATDPARDRFLGVHLEPDTWEGRRALRASLEAQVAASPRGTWALLRRLDPAAGQDFHTAAMSDGTGRHAAGCHYDTYGTAPSYAAVHRRMAGFEAYLARGRVEAERRQAQNLDVIAARGFAVGQTYRNLVFGSVPYSTATVTALNPAPNPWVVVIGADARGPGWLSLTLTRRGSPKRYNADLSASLLARALDEAAPPLAPAPLLPA